MKDPEIRGVLRKREFKKYSSDPHTKIVEELRLTPAAAQIDIAVINGVLHGYEIKSASDSLYRLPNQIEAYTKIFDFVTVVSETKYLNKLYSILPYWVGISICSDNKLNLERAAQRNIHIEGFHVAQLLWKNEIIEVLREKNISFKSYHRVWTLCEIMSDNLTPNEISNIVRVKLKNRNGWKESKLV